jgi:hypothetical protein
VIEEAWLPQRLARWGAKIIGYARLEQAPGQVNHEGHEEHEAETNRSDLFAVISQIGRLNLNADLRRA